MSFPSMTATWHNDTYPAIDPTRPELSARGKMVVVSGGSSGIGRETVRAFAAAGATSIAVLARRLEHLEETKKLVISEFANVDITLHVVDISDPVQVKAAADAIGKWDIFVMNAGYMTSPGKLENAVLADWWKAWEINVKGVFVLAQAFLPHRNTGASVIGTSTAVVSLDISMQANFSSYAGSKLALVRLFEVLAVENPDTHFVTFHPGLVETDMFEKSGMQGFPMDSVKLPAHFAVWLASPEASFLRGKFAWTNWDVDELKRKSKSIEETAILTSGIFGWPFQP